MEADSNGKEILKDEILTDDELDNVAGGTYSQTFEDMDRFNKSTGFQFTGSNSDKREQLRDILFRCGVKIKDHGGSDANEYYLLDQSGNRVRSMGQNEAINYAIANYQSGHFIC